MENNENKIQQPEQPEAKQPETATQTTTGNSTTPAAPKKPEEEPKSSFTVEPIDFPEIMTSVFMNGAQLRDKVDNLFKSILADYVGCELKIYDGDPNKQICNIGRYVPPGGAYINLIFKENTSNTPGYKALKRRSDTKGSAILDRLNFTLGAQSARAYLIDPDVLEALEEFFPVDQKKKKNIQWEQDRRIQERMNYGYGQNMFMTGVNYGGAVEVVVMGLPIDMILRKIYGAGKDGTMSYAVNAFRTTVDGANELVFNVARMDTEGVEMTAKALGVYNRPWMPSWNSMPMMAGYNPPSWQ